MDSAPSSSVVGIHGLHNLGAGAGLGVQHHLIANSEASLLRISSDSNNRKSFVPRINQLGRSGSSEKHCSEPKMNALFEKYRDCDDAILVPGTEALLNDLELRPDEFRVLIFAWKCNAEQMCRFSRVEFVSGCRVLNADNLKNLQQKLPEAAAEALARPDMFKDLYR
jgi:DCN1-like protein 3